MPWFTRCAVLLSVGSSVLFSTAATPAATFQGLGNFPGVDASSRAFAVSDDGTAVVGYASIPGFSTAYRWTAALGVLPLGDFTGGSFSSASYGISGDGQTVVGFGTTATAEQPFRWSETGGFQNFANLSHVYSQGLARDASADGSVIVGKARHVVTHTQAFRWTEAGGMQWIGVGEAFATSADGSVVVGWTEASFGEQAFRWTQAEGMVPLGFLNGAGTRSGARGLSADGSVIVGASNSTGQSDEAIRWTAAGGMQGLGFLPGGDYSLALGVSADGSTIVGLSLSDFGSRPFIWNSSSGMLDLQIVLESAGVDLTGWQLRGAYDISADGRTIVGEGINPQGQLEAWIATVPEPSSLAISLAGLVAVVLATVRRAK